MMFPSETLWYILALKPQRNEEIGVEGRAKPRAIHTDVIRPDERGEESAAPP
jgi:hypothetical protein